MPKLHKTITDAIKTAIVDNALNPNEPVTLVVFGWSKGGRYGPQPKVQAYTFDHAPASPTYGQPKIAFWPHDFLQDNALFKENEHGNYVAKYTGMTTNSRDISTSKWYWTTNGCGFDKLHDICRRLHVALGRSGQESTYNVIQEGYNPRQITISKAGY